MKNTYRFTLIELLAVVALIAILSGIGFGTYSYVRGKAKESATEAMMKQIEAGLESFHTKNGYYPPTGGEFKPVIFKFNLTNGTLEYIDFGGTGGKLTYKPDAEDGLTKEERMENERLESFTKAVDMQVIKENRDKDNCITDAWGGKIYYRSPGEFKKGSYDLISAGADGKFGQSTTDIPSTTLTDFRELSGEKLCDDLFTF